MTEPTEWMKSQGYYNPNHKTCDSCNDEGGRALEFSTGLILPGECGECGKMASKEHCDGMNQNAQTAQTDSMDKFCGIPMDSSEVKQRLFMYGYIHKDEAVKFVEVCTECAAGLIPLDHNVDECPKCQGLGIVVKQEMESK